jgi:uncharacterized protein YneF (UPF0154 family)
MTAFLVAFLIVVLFVTARQLALRLLDDNPRTGGRTHD